MTLTQSCDPSTIRRDTEPSTCGVTVQNNSPSAADGEHREHHQHQGLRVTGVTGATKVSDREWTARRRSPGGEPGVPTIAPGELLGYLPLDAFGVTPIADRRRAGAQLQRAGVRFRRQTVHPARRDVRTATWSPGARPGRTSTPSRRPSPTRRGPTTCWRRSGPTSTAPARRASSSPPSPTGSTPGSSSSGA